jgi:exosortase
MAKKSTDRVSRPENGNVVWAYIREHPTAAILLLTLSVTMVYFYAYCPVFSGFPLAKWTWIRWRPEYNQEHSWAVPFIFGYLLWYHRKAVFDAPKTGSNWGIPFIAIGLVCYIVGARALQGRIALIGLPFLIFGIILYIWGKRVARILAFPVVCLLFLVPLGVIEQTSFRLQFIVTGVVKFLSSLLGINIQAVGTTLTATDGTFNFDIAEGCSGIRSLVAMVMLSAVYVHLFQKSLWKKAAVALASGLFAIIGNVGRIFTIIIIARLGYPEFAAGIYHDYSAFIFFPIALATMVAFNNLLNVNFRQRQPFSEVQSRKREVSV